MPDSQKFYLTTPIYYVNARPHIGHAYTTLAADVIARRHRLLGDDTFFLTGTDEHGQKIERSAAAAGIAPQQFADEVADSFQALWKRMGITNNDYIRTTEPRHQRGAQKLFADLHARGQIYLSSYTGQYSVGEEMFVEGPPGTIGPDGRPTETVTEENFFFRLSEYQEKLLNLIESNELSIQPEGRRNEVLSFLRGNVAEYQRADQQKVNASNETIAGESSDQQKTVILSEAIAGKSSDQRKTVILSEATAGSAAEGPASSSAPALAYSAAGTPYVPGTLRDLSVSRSSFTWGIPVPEPAASETKERHVIYVWLDALANYMTALGYGSDAPEDIARFKKFWPADLHLVGKEIIRFHCVYWPAFLMAAGLPLPKAITAHGWLLFDDAKMSKSKGNIVRTETILDAFGTEVYAKQFPESTKQEQDLFATDVLRYFLLREIPFGSDGSFNFDAMITRYNADLANGYGNLVSRTLSMIEKYCSGAISMTNSVSLADLYDRSLLTGHLVYQLGVRSQLKDFGAVLEDHRLPPTASGSTRVAIAELVANFLENTELDLALERISRFISGVDTHITSTAPWNLAKLPDRRDQLEGVLYIAAEAIRIITALLYPILPNATAKVWLQLGLGDIEIAAKNGDLKNLQWGGLKPGTKLGPLAPIFPRADKGLAPIMIDIEAGQAAPIKPTEEATTIPAPASPAAEPAAAATPETPQIAIDDFVKIDLRVAQIIVAERIPKADKLLRLEVDLGYEKRQILSGIAQWYTPEELIGRRIVVIANLAPRKMRGLESHGMLLAASEGEDGKPVLATFGENIALGSRLK